jgi:lambda repressor-like predicted transcriptional regulator
MQRKMKWMAGAAVAGGLLVGSLLASSAAAQTPVSGVGPGPGVCPGFGMMTAGFGPAVSHQAIADALGMSSQELWDAQAGGTSIAELARQENVDLSTVADAALAAHTAQLDAAVQAGSLTQAQADAMQQLMRSRIEAQLQTGGGFRGWGPGMMGGRGMMGWPGSGTGRRAF